MKIRSNACLIWACLAAVALIATTRLGVVVAGPGSHLAALAGLVVTAELTVQFTVWSVVSELRGGKESPAPEPAEPRPSPAACFCGTGLEHMRGEGWHCGRPKTDG